ncbi:MAG: hypothetical protein ACREH8_10760 [Opitutaceae bacterium]
MDPSPALVTRHSSAAVRTAERARGSSFTGNPTPPAAPASRFATCLRRFATAGLRLVVTTPYNNWIFARGIKRFPERHIDRAAHAEWETAYLKFCGRESLSHDRGSWRILAVDRDDHVVGAITGRFFCGEIVRDHVQVLSLFDRAGPVFREHCELAVSEVVEACRETGRTPAEISHWAVAPVWHAALIAVTLVRAMGALAAAFDAPVAVMAADNRRGEVNRLMRLGSTPLGLSGHSCLPPFVHHESGAWLRLLVLDAAAFHARNGNTAAADLNLLREQASIISAG